MTKTRMQVALASIFVVAAIAALLVSTHYLSYDGSWNRHARNSLATNVAAALKAARPYDATSATTIVHNELGAPKYKHNPWELCELTDRTPVRIGISASDSGVVLVVHNRVDGAYDLVEKGSSVRVLELPGGMQVTWFAGIRAQ